MSEKVCSICLEKPKHKTWIPRISKDCIHEFCQECIVNWLKSQEERCVPKSCPVCRRCVK